MGICYRGSDMFMVGGSSEDLPLKAANEINFP